MAVLAAIVAGCEVLFRLGDATRHSAEKRGFHAPGLTGPIGAAVAAGHLLRLDATAMANAIGIAASMSGGLLEFAKSGSGGMVKRLQLARAAESGIVAARLAADGFTGPSTALEGAYGFLQVFCTESETDRLVRALGTEWETLKICFKRYPCHITAHTPIEAMAALRREYDVATDAIQSIEVRGNAKMVALHAIAAPTDLIMAQYSIPWCLAAALLRDAADPATFGDVSYADPNVAALARRIAVADSAPTHLSPWGTVVAVRLRDGRVLTRECDDFPGTPSMPASDEDLRRKFLALAPDAAALYDRIMAMERAADLTWLG
jgi:2-methylcitrate dehydratase PrpD